MFRGGIRTFRKTACALWCIGFVLVPLPALAKASDATSKSQAVAELRPLPAGVTLPVAMGRTLRAGEVKPGTVFLVKTTQRVPVSEDTFLNPGAAVRGEWVA